MGMRVQRRIKGLRLHDRLRLLVGVSRRDIQCFVHRRKSLDPVRRHRRFLEIESGHGRRPAGATHVMGFVLWAAVKGSIVEDNVQRQDSTASCLRLLRGASCRFHCGLLAGRLRVVLCDPARVGDVLALQVTPRCGYRRIWDRLKSRTGPVEFNLHRVAK